MSIQIENPLGCPLRVSVSSDNLKQHKLVSSNTPVTLREKSDTILRYYIPDQNAINLNFFAAFGNTEQEIRKNIMALPFPKNKRYKVIQGYHGTFSHQSNYSRYAIDFDLKINDTICASDHGVVVGVIKDYQYGGTSKKWRNTDKSNFITLYHPHSGLFTQYVHLTHLGSFVEVGDQVEKGDPIGLSGATGFTNVEHLHFNVLIPVTNGTLVSTEIEFENGYVGKELKIGDYLSNKINH